MRKYTCGNRKKIINDLAIAEEPKIFNIGSLDLWLNSKVLVPHPHTLILVNRAIKLIHSENINVIADVGTGSGFIALSLAKNYPNKKFYATDVSKEALAIAQRNAKENNITNVIFLLNTSHEWLDELVEVHPDLIISNPPFVGTHEYEAENFIKTFPEILLEPYDAICTGDCSGEEPFLAIAKKSIQIGVPNLLLQGNSETIPAIVHRLNKRIGNYFSFRILKHAGLPRFILATKLT